MIKAAIKLGPQDWQAKLKQSNSKYVEVWHRIDKPEWYLKLFEHLKSNHINTGLHFWAAINNKIEPNIAYPGELSKQTIKLIKTSIDTAAKYNFHYVNIHAGNLRPILINLKKSIFTPDLSSKLATKSQALTTAKQAIRELTEYAHKRSLLLLIETIPPNTPTGSTKNPKSRLKAQNYYSISVADLLGLLKQTSFHITNDLSHTFCAVFNQPLKTLWQALYKNTKTLAPFTKLIHVNSVVPPYNGTDSHHGILNKDFKRPGIFPTKLKLKKLLNLFKHRNDVWAVVEPYNDHVLNYQALRTLTNS